MWELRVELPQLIEACVSLERELGDPTTARAYNCVQYYSVRDKVVEIRRIREEARTLAENAEAQD
ncbi:MAG: hypothetical protein M3069_12220 [Chloroflexota bacterium]|nr:hypothetical protein [Chloroflexota bacterium]